MKTPKVGETWMRRTNYEDREVKILEEVVNPCGGILYLVSYYSPALKRRSCETVNLSLLYTKPEPVLCEGKTIEIDGVRYKLVKE